MQKTIFISSFHPFISRNILSTPVISHVLKADNDYRIVMLVPDYKKEYFTKNFARDRVVIEGIRLGGRPKFRTLFFKRFAQAMLDTETTRIQKRSKLHNEGGILYFLGSYAAVGFGKFSLIRRLVRFLDYWYADFERFNEVLTKYKPDFVIATDVQNEYNVSLLQAARFYGIKAIAMVRSWDNLTSMQGVMRVTAQALLVPTTRLKEEAIRYHDVPQDRIRVVGIPHYDRYRAGEKMSREDFFKSMGVDPEKKLILYTTLGDRYKGTASVDQTVLEVLNTFDANVVIRCHPGDTITLDDLFKPTARMLFDRPGVVFNKTNFGDREISAEDDKKLEHELFYADAVIFCASTIAVDAALFGKPMIGVAFSENPVPYWASPVRFYDYTHLKGIVKSGGMCVARSREELAREIRECLGDPSSGQEGREKIVSMQGGFADAESSSRVAKTIIQYIDTSKDKEKQQGFQNFLREVKRLGGKKLVQGHATRSILGMVYDVFEFTKKREHATLLNIFASRDDSGFRESVYQPLFSHAEYWGVDMWQDKFIYENKTFENSYTLPFPNNSFDAIMTTKVVLEHISEPELTLREIKRVLKSGGEAFLVAPFITIAHQAPHDFFRYTEYGLKHLFNKVGFEIVSIWRSNSDFMTTMDARAMFSSAGILPWMLRRAIAVYTKNVRYPVAQILDCVIPNQGRFTKYYICRVKKL